MKMMRPLSHIHAEDNALSDPPSFSFAFEKCHLPSIRLYRESAPFISARFALYGALTNLANISSLEANREISTSSLTTRLPLLPPAQGSKYWAGVQNVTKVREGNEQ